MHRMEIAIVGAGYVGAVTGAGLAGLGHRISFVDRDETVVRRLEQNSVGFFEPGLEQLLADNRERIGASTDLSAAVAASDLTDGSDLSGRATVARATFAPCGWRAGISGRPSPEPGGAIRSWSRARCPRGPPPG